MNPSRGAGFSRHRGCQSHHPAPDRVSYENVPHDRRHHIHSRRRESFLALSFLRPHHTTGLPASGCIGLHQRFRRNRRWDRPAHSDAAIRSGLGIDRIADRGVPRQLLHGILPRTLFETSSGDYRILASPAAAIRSHRGCLARFTKAIYSRSLRYVFGGALVATRKQF
jgi:hypothetical protein